MSEQSPVYQKTRILIHMDNQGMKCWIIETRPQVNAAMQQLFAWFDENGCYAEQYIDQETKDLLLAARAGEHMPIYRILKARQEFDGERWWVDYATDATVVVSAK